jgi:hypothetical protein
MRRGLHALASAWLAAAEARLATGATAEAFATTAEAGLAAESGLTAQTRLAVGSIERRIACTAVERVGTVVSAACPIGRLLALGP